MMLDETLKITTPNDNEIAMTRVFNAPRDLVFDCWTTPELMKRWFHPNAWTLSVCEIDLRVGGEYRYVWRSPEGQEMGMGGVYREIVPIERLVASEKFDDSWYDGECIDTTTFTEENGMTTLMTIARYDSKEIRDTILQSGMATGVESSYNQLADLLQTLKAEA